MTTMMNPPLAELEARLRRSARFGLTDIGGRGLDPFFNIDTPADMEETERLPAGEI
jgi:hypothetical protein